MSRETIYESHVSVALFDLVKSGGTVFDCGANVGYLTKTLSRLSGPRGLVVAFEANPNLLYELTARLNGVFATNTWIENCAVAEVDKILNFMTNVDNPQGGHIESCDAASDKEVAAGFVSVATPARALDSYCHEHKLTPDLIKMDIEGAEILALRGARRQIIEHRPKIILEQHIGDGNACMRFLDDLGYLGLDLKHWELVDPNVGVKHGSVSDVLFFHKESDMPPPYLERRIEPVAQVSVTETGVSETQECQLGPGRYVIELIWEVETDGFIRQFLWLDGSPLSRSDGQASWIQASYRFLTISLPLGGRLRGGVDVGESGAKVRMSGMNIREILPRHPIHPGALG